MQEDERLCKPASCKSDRRKLFAGAWLQTLGGLHLAESPVPFLMLVWEIEMNCWS
jgi:hypothetical protein